MLFVSYCLGRAARRPRSLAGAQPAGPGGEMQMSLQGSVALVTGAAPGTGSGIARAERKHG
jgi:hypothetical protein